ncbi:MAG TPA: NrsF family protein [Bryobacteraceae bacterium]|jgi:hypothetical protein
MNSEDKELRAMFDGLRTPGDLPDAERVERIQRRIASSLKPVKPLPSDRALLLIGLGCFAALALLPTIHFGDSALHVLSGVQEFAYYGVIALLAILFAAAIVEQMIPGSKRRLNARMLVIGSFFSLALLACLLFENFSMDHFVAHGWPCLRLGSECALVSGLIAFLLVRKGFFTAPVASSMLIGCFAGLSGVAALALICPVRNAPHILVWHLGTMILGALGGGVVGVLRKL